MGLFMLYCSFLFFNVYKSLNVSKCKYTVCNLFVWFKMLNHYRSMLNTITFILIPHKLYYKLCYKYIFAQDLIFLVNNLIMTGCFLQKIVFCIWNCRKRSSYNIQSSSVIQKIWQHIALSHDPCYFRVYKSEILHDAVPVICTLLVPHYCILVEYLKWMFDQT